MKTIYGIKVSNRFEEVEKMQNVFTEHGNIITTRLGLHTNNQAKEHGIILLELDSRAGEEEMALETELERIDGIEVKKMTFS